MCKVNPRPPGRVYCQPCATAYQQAWRAKHTPTQGTCRRCHTLPHRPKGWYCAACKVEATRERLTRNRVVYRPSTSAHRVLTSAVPSNLELEAYIGWHIDRWTSTSYNRSRHDDDACVQLYLMGHQAIKRFWVSMNGTAWEMGPDLVDYVDGGTTRMTVLHGKRYAPRVKGRGRSVS